MKPKSRIIFVSLTVLIIAFFLIASILLKQDNGGLGTPPVFDSKRGLEDIRYQLSFGPRFPGSAGHDREVAWIREKLRDSGWKTQVQQSTLLNHEILNIYAWREKNHSDELPWIILGTHYDTRLKADRDKDLSKATQPVPGANDGASGVAVLLELARVLPSNLNKNIWLVFFDAEDNGNFPGWDWILGSRVFVDSLSTKPDKVIIVDMVADSDLTLYIEKNSNPDLSAEIWAKAGELGHSQFIPTPKHRIIDDHLPFLKNDIPAVDIIDLDYPYWHTSEDTLDKVSAESLQAVGSTILAWLLEEEYINFQFTSS